MKFTTYIAEAEKQYHFRMKTVVALDDDKMDRIEMAVARYQPISISRPKKTMLQKHPMDFIELENFEVFIVDITLGLPASPYILQQEIRQNLNIPEKYVVVRGDGEPIEVQGEVLSALDDIKSEAKKRGLKPASLFSDPNYEEASAENADEYTGNAYNARLLSYLKQVADEREDTRVDAPQLFKWLDKPDRLDGEPKVDTSDFNAHVVKKVAPGPKTKPAVGTHGQNRDNLTVTRLYKDKDGNRVKLSRKLDSVRGEKE